MNKFVEVLEQMFREEKIIGIPGETFSVEGVEVVVCDTNVDNTLLYGYYGCDTVMVVVVKVGNKYYKATYQRKNSEKWEFQKIEQVIPKKVITYVRKKN